MLCSISSCKSGSNWLDRLRSSKGFPAGNDLDLEQFLNQHDPNQSNSSDNKVTDSITNDIELVSNSKPSQSSERPILDGKQTMEIPRENGEKEWLGIMNNVLAELFNMEDSRDYPRVHGKKSYRKQPNPKICVLSTSVDVDDTRTDDARRGEGGSPTIPSSGDNSRVDTKENIDEMKPPELQEDAIVGSVDGDQEEKSHAELSAFSRTEVTVIDTSCPSWKVEKLLFRRKNVWKVRDKKCKSMVMSTSGKKRKAAPPDESVGREKRLKLSVVPCGSAKESNTEDCNVASTQGHHQKNKMEEASKGTRDILSQVPKKRCPRKLKKGGSSAVLIKSVPTSKKNGVSIPKSCTKSTKR